MIEDPKFGSLVESIRTASPHRWAIDGQIDAIRRGEMPFPFYSLSGTETVVFIGAFAAMELLDLALRYANCRILCVETDLGYVSHLSVLLNLWSIRNVELLTSPEELGSLLDASPLAIGYLRAYAYIVDHDHLESLVSRERCEFACLNYYETSSLTSALIEKCRANVTLAHLREEYSRRSFVVRRDSQKLFSIVLPMDVGETEGASLLKAWTDAYRDQAQYILLTKNEQDALTLSGLNDQANVTIIPRDTFWSSGTSEGVLTCAVGKYVILAQPGDKPTRSARETLVIAQASVDFDVAIGGYALVWPDTQTRYEFETGDFGRDVRWSSGRIALEEGLSSDIISTRYAYRTDFLRDVIARMHKPGSTPFHVHNAAVAMSNCTVAVSDLIMERNWLRSLNPPPTVEAVQVELDEACNFLSEFVPAAKTAQCERHMYEVTLRRCFSLISEMKDSKRQRAALDDLMSLVIKLRGPMNRMRKSLYISGLSERTAEVLKLQ